MKDLFFWDRLQCKTMYAFIYFSKWSVSQFSHSVLSNSLQPHESQHARLPCPSPTPGVHPNSCASSRWSIQQSHPLSSPTPPAPNPSQHQSLFQWVNSSHEVAKVLELQIQHQSFQWIFKLIAFRINWFGVLLVQKTLKSLLHHHCSKASIL